jgi:hypothetical protein
MRHEAQIRHRRLVKPGQVPPVRAVGASARDRPCATAVRGAPRRQIGIGSEIVLRRKMGGEVLAIVEQQRRARRMRLHKLPRKPREIRLSEQAADGRKIRFQRPHQSHRDIVAIDGIAPGLPALSLAQARALPGSAGLRQRRLPHRSQLAWRKSGWASVAWAARMASAASASAFNTDHSGTSLSHSMSVGVGPSVAITCSNSAQTSAETGRSWASISSGLPSSSASVACPPGEFRAPDEAGNPRGSAPAKSRGWWRRRRRCSHPAAGRSRCAAPPRG